MAKKPKKFREEKIAENYFPVDTSDLKYTTEKQVKEFTPNPEEILKKSTEKKVLNSQPKEEITKGAVEKVYKKPSRSSLEKVEKRTYKKRKSRKTNKIEYSPPKIKLKKSGYELIITEKPQAALKIANALGKAVQKTNAKVPYYEVDRNKEKIIVACAVGHLFTLKQNTPSSVFPTFDISWIPNYLARKKDFTKRYYDTLLKLAKGAGSLTVATDFDVEGEVIGLNVVRFICNQKDANRMKFSTLTEKELNKAYENKLKKIVWGQAIAGETRHYLDWFYGINLSKALMNAIKTTGKFRIMSIGRVQGPALNMIVKKEREIQKFESVPYWQIFITVKNSHILELKHNKDILGPERVMNGIDKLEKFENLDGKTAQAKTKKTEQILPPHPPFNLTTLQIEAYKFHGITPSKTLRAAQSLYLAGLISYPRTSSQKLPKEINYKEILDKLKIRYKVSKLITKKEPIEGKKSDPAHPSIYPTGNKQILSGDEEKIYNLVVKRFLSLFCDDAIIDKKTITATIDNLIFSTRGSAVRKKAWMEIYPSKLKENQIPDLEGEVKIIKTKIEEKETQPPKRYSPASILSELEKRNLGTKATRSSILETLYDRGYIRDQSVKATPLGMALIESLEKHSPIIIDESLTRSFEASMDSIKEAKKDFEKKEEKIISKAKKAITDIAKDFKKNEKEIGKELLKANVEFREQQKIENKLIQCPVCKKGNLAITYSKKTRRFFIACDAYPNCKTTFSLPPNGQIKKTEKICEECNYPMLMRLMKGRRPWIFCWNPKCPTNAEWANKSAKYNPEGKSEKSEQA
ncbi:DNA topoisomerase I [Candidatus Pacearchaeota archaeon]|nr:DNA topoisomerase I [Candidatus Pacearchaeota archaeon]